MKYVLPVILFAMVACPPAFTQSRVLAGTIKMAGQPVKGLTVYTSFKTTFTDDLGRYAIALDGCASCKPGDKLMIYTYHDEYGSGEEPCIIPADFRHDFSIVRNPSRILIAGIVRDALTREAIPGMEVTVLAEGEMEPVKTNRFGEFRILLRRDMLQNKNAVRIQVIDASKKYKAVHADPQLFDINTFNILEMESRQSASLQVSGFTKTKICVKKGHIITINAGGQIRVGLFVGNSDPDGRAGGVANLSLTDYNIVPEFNHGVLMYRFEGETAWKACGKHKIIIASVDGCLEFQVNDNNQSDNQGNYEVEVMIKTT